MKKTYQKVSIHGDAQIDIRKSLLNLQNVLEEFIAFFQQDNDLSTLVNTSWNAKDILGHITFWHESFARNVSSLGNQQKPNVLKGKLSDVNQMSVQSNKKLSVMQLIANLKDAQKTVEDHIFNKNIESIPYKKGSRDYTRKEHLEIVCNHIKKHLKDLKKISNAKA